MKKTETPVTREEFQKWRKAFLKRDLGSAEAFKKIADTLSPKWFEWHSWTNRIIDAACTERFVGLSGCSGCVAGHTKLLDPITGREPTFEYLYANGISPTVMTLDGPRKASVPFIKGEADLFEIVLENGYRFVATAEHVVLSSSGFVSVKSLSLGQRLFAYAPSLQESISEPSPLARGPNADCFQKIIVNYQDDYPPFSCSDDAQLRLAKAACRSFVPLPVDAPTHTHCDCNEDGLGVSNKHNRAWLQFFPPSNDRSAHHHSSLGTDVLRRGDLNISLLFDRSLLPQLCKFPSKNDCCGPSPLPDRDFLHRHTSTQEGFLCLRNPKMLPVSLCSLGTSWRWTSKVENSAPHGVFLSEKEHTDYEFLPIDSSQCLSAYRFRVSQSGIVSIRKSSHTHPYYDVSVPGPEHYFAEGAIHHNSAKTRNVAGFAGISWIVSPHDTSVIFCSTTMKMLRKRGWAEIQNLQQSLGEEFGNLVDSRTTWQYKQGDDKHGVYGLAVAEGDTNKSAANIQGLHTKNQIVIIDEAEAVPAAIWKATSNLWRYCIDNGGYFLLIAIANPRSRLSQFGRFIEPEDGWNSVGVDTEEWYSKPQLDGSKALVLRFDFLKSPNIIEDRVVSKHLPSKRAVDARMAALRARGGENDPDHFCYDRGFPAPEGLSKTVFTESLFEKFKAYDKHEFIGTGFMIIGAIDPAYGGGDRPVIRFAAMGDIAGHKKGIEWCGEPITCYFDTSSPLPARYQLLEQIKKHCESVEYRGKTYKCEPENFGIDCTGDAGLADIAQMEWSQKVVRINFSSSPSEEPCSHEDSRPAKEVWLNKRSEMYWRTQSGVISGQIKGVDKDTAAELTTIEEIIEKTDGSVRPKKTLQNKRQYKQKFGKSPDYSDVAVELTEVARLRGFHVAAVGLTVKRDEEWERTVTESDEVYAEEGYSKTNLELQYDDAFSEQ